MAALAAAALVAASCGDEFKPGTAPPGSSVGGAGAAGSSSGGDGGAGAGGSGGAAPCGGDCAGATPYCDETKMECVACLDHPQCSDAAAAKCDDGSCVACDDSAQCAGITDASICELGACVECTADDDSACGGSETCDLLASECVDVAAGSVENCEACSNDAQCESGHRCVAMDFEGSAHGHYCLELPAPTCDRPFLVGINKPSLNGEAATDYCGIEEDLATCEAVLALVGGWFCTGTEGMCSALDGGTEIAVPGAICEPVGLGGDSCTYACAQANQCLAGSPGNTCGDDGTPPMWCGG